MQHWTLQQNRYDEWWCTQIGMIMKFPLPLDYFNIIMPTKSEGDWECDRYSYILMNCYCENKSILIFKHFICVSVYDCIYSCKIISWFSFLFYLLCMCLYIFELLISLLCPLSWIVSDHTLLWVCFCYLNCQKLYHEKLLISF